MTAERCEEKDTESHRRGSTPFNVGCSPIRPPYPSFLSSHHMLCLLARTSHWNRNHAGKSSRRTQVEPLHGEKSIGRTDVLAEPFFRVTWMSWLAGHIATGGCYVGTHHLFGDARAYTTRQVHLRNCPCTNTQAFFPILKRQRPPVTTMHLSRQFDRPLAQKNTRPTQLTRLTLRLRLLETCLMLRQRDGG